MASVFLKGWFALTFPWCSSGLYSCTAHFPSELWFCWLVQVTLPGEVVKFKSTSVWRHKQCRADQGVVFDAGVLRVSRMNLRSKAGEVAKMIMLSQATVVTPSVEIMCESFTSSPGLPKDFSRDCCTLRWAVIQTPLDREACDLSDSVLRAASRDFSSAQGRAKQ